MSKATALVNKVDSTLKKFAPLRRVAYKRVITRTGGDDLIGRSGAVTYSDTELTPQPIYQMLGRQSITGRHARPSAVLSGSDKAVTADDYSFLVSPTAVSLDELTNKYLQLVLKDSSGNEEVFDILDYEPIDAYGDSVVLTVYARSTKR